VHVLFTLDTWGLIGGTERYAVVVVPALIERGHRVTILCREDQRGPEGGVEVIEVPELGGAGLSRAARHALSRAVRHAEPDVVYLSTLRNLDALDELLELAPLLRYVHDHTLFCPGLNKYREDGELCRDPMGRACLERYWVGSGCVCFKPAGHSNRLTDPLREVSDRWREIELTQRASRVLTNSKYMRGELLQVGFSPDTTDVLYLFTRSNTDAQPAGPLPKETERFLSGSDPIVFTPARLTLPDKGVDYLLTALGSIERPFRAVIAGTGPAEEWLRQKAIEEGLAERVHFTGWMSSEAIESLYERANVVVCPSVWDEPFGLVGIESMSHGKPVVAFDVGGIPEWLADGESGLLIPRKDVHGMARAIERLLDDDELARGLGDHGRELVALRFPSDAHVKRLESLLVEAAD
jgi:glycosyltransferase involved in cell wall biosynthesis